MTTQINFKCWSDVEHELLGDDYYNMQPDNRMRMTDYKLENLYKKGYKIKVGGYSYPFYLK